MNIKVKSGDISAIKADGLVLFINSGSKRPAGTLAEIDKALDGAIANLLKKGEAKGKANELTTLHTLGKLPGIDAAQSQSRFFVRYHDLDINQHVNNVKYIEWLLESIPGFGRKGLTLKELELNYLGEAFKGDRIISMCRKDNPSGTRFSHSIIRQEDRLELIRAKTCWEEK